MCDIPSEKATFGPTTKFSFYINAGAQPREIVADKNQMLHAAICKCVKDVSAFNHIFLGDVKGHDDQVVVHPLLLCGWLKDGGSVVMSKRKEDASLAEGRENVSSTVDEETIFFVKMTDRFQERTITISHYTVYDGKDICVTATKGDSLLKALTKDGRFVDIEKWKMHYKQIRTEPSMVDAKAEEFHNAIFTVYFQPTNRKRTMPGLQETPVNRKKSHAAKIDESNASSENVAARADSPVPSVEDCLTSEMIKDKVDSVKSNAYSTLLKPNEKGDKGIRIVARKFAKNIPNGKPARLLLPLSKHMQSVGRLVCGNVQATCFLISTQIILTSFHVLLSINDARRKSTDPLICQKIKVFFDYLNLGQTEHLGEEEVDEIRVPKPRIYNAKLDYVLFCLKMSQSLEERVPLGPYVRNLALRDIEGLVTIIGHPSDREKLEETCAVVPHYLWRNELLNRVQENRPSKPGFDEVLHMVKKDIISEKYEQSIPYDTSCLFQGSSGSPVFNMDGHIIALHTQGYTLEENGKTTAFMEFGVSCNAIYEDILEFHGSEVARTLFPNCKQLNKPSSGELMDVQEV